MTTRRGRPPRDLGDIMVAIEYGTPAERKAAQRALVEYDKRRTAERAAREAAEKAAGKHPSATQWLAERPHLLLMLRDQHGMSEDEVRASFLTFEESQPQDWLYGPLGMMLRPGTRMFIAEVDNEDDGTWYERDRGKHYEQPLTDGQVEVNIAERILDAADEEVAKRCGEWRAGKYDLPVVAPKRKRRTKAEMHKAKDAARKRAARADGRVKPKPRRTRTTWQWFQQQCRAMETLAAKYPKAPLPLSKRQAEVLGRAARAVTVWADRVEKYGPDHVWLSRPDYYAATGTTPKPWLALEDWIAQKKATGKWVDWGALKRELAELKARITVP